MLNRHRVPTRRREVSAVAVIVAAAALLTACHHKAQTTTGGPPKWSSSSAAPTPSPTSAPPAPARNPLTGIGAPPRTPVIAVKIDDTAPGRPQRAIDKADVVYVEEAEGGLSRLVVVFGTYKPVVGYVRSTRPSDPDLLLQYGKITEAASGGGHDALPLLDKSGIKGWIMDRGAAYYSRLYRPQSTYINVVLDLNKVAHQIKTPAPKSIGWTWNAATTGLPSTKGYDLVTRVGSQRVEFRWYRSLHRYVRYIDGVAQHAADGKLVATPNVIVQTCKIVPHPQDTDVNGNPSQFTVTVGSGAVSVFRNGRRIDGTWSRGSLSSGTVLKDRHGKVIALAPGGAWVALVRKGVRTTAS